LSAIPLEARGGTYTVVLPTDKGTHWFVLVSGSRP